MATLPHEPDRDDAADAADRRQADRRGTIDLTRPGYLERRSARQARRSRDDEQLKRDADTLPPLDPPLPPRPTAAAPAADAEAGEPSKPLAELEADFLGLQAAMDKRNQLLKDLPPDEYEAVQARDEELVTTWAAEFHRLQREIAVARRRQSEASPRQRSSD